MQLYSALSPKLKICEKPRQRAVSSVQRVTSVASRILWTGTKSVLPGQYTPVPRPCIRPPHATSASEMYLAHVPDFSQCVSALDTNKEKTMKQMEEHAAAKPVLQHVGSAPLAGGTLELVKWYGERMLRIWTPPGYNKSVGQAQGGYPVLYLHDGQNLFTPDLCMSGKCWEAATSAASLIQAGTLPPFVIVGIDHTGMTRSYDYNPYVPGTGPGGFRQDASTWPGGGINLYMARLVNEVMPYAVQQYGLSTNPSLIAIGGSSFGGIATLCLAMRYPHVFGSALVESPSLWVNDAKFMNEDIANYEGPLPERIFVAMGDVEYSGVRPPTVANTKADAWLAEKCGVLGDIFEGKGLKRGDRLWCEVEKGATHNEYCWAQRLPRALTFLCAHWKSLVG